MRSRDRLAFTVGELSRSTGIAARALHHYREIGLRKLFEGSRHEDHAEQIRARWDDTDAQQDSARRTEQYGKQEWEAIRSESEAICERLGELMRQGVAVPEAVVQLAVADHRAHIERWF